jgi:hypothetical protein
MMKKFGLSFDAIDICGILVDATEASHASSDSVEGCKFTSDV